tara:strand:- start:972 stop:1514 length:543 start_codon:yes stop_codon:yes gene_type:complete
MRVLIQRFNDPMGDGNFEDVVQELNREENILYLRNNAPQGEVMLIQNQDTGQRHVYLPGYSMSFEIALLYELPWRFRHIIDLLIMRAAEDRSRNFDQPKIVKPVSVEHGRQYFITQKLLEGKKCEKNCSICLEPLLPEGKKRKKVWELECGDSFCVGCIRKWFKEDSRCPNCRRDCAEYL